MSTKCRIGIQKPNGKIESVICYKDGYPEYAGQMLADHYSESEAIVKLLAGGDILELGETTDLTMYEHRNRGIEWEKAEPVTYSSLKKCLTATDEVDFIYIFKDNRWTAYGAN